MSLEQTCKNTTCAKSAVVVSVMTMLEWTQRTGTSEDATRRAKVPTSPSAAGTGAKEMRVGMGQVGSSQTCKPIASGQVHTRFFKRPGK